jgi:3-(methylthio)propanoyl-CoA dehydrogenase
MSTYAAPIRDMKFAIKELVGMDQIAKLPGCEEVTPDLLDAVLEEAGKFATGVLDPLNWPGDQEGAKLKNHEVTTAAGFSQAFRQFCEGGWVSLAARGCRMSSRRRPRRCGTRPACPSACALC